MSRTFNTEEVLEIIKEIHKQDYDFSIKDYANANSFDKETAVKYATEEFAHEKGWIE